MIRSGGECAASRTEGEHNRSEDQSPTDDVASHAPKKKRNMCTLAQEERINAQRGGQGLYGPSDIDMRKQAIRMREEGRKASAIRRELLQRYPYTKLPGPRAIQKWVSQKEEIQRAARSEDATMRNRSSVAKQLNNILHEQLKDFEATGGIITDHVICQMAQKNFDRKRRRCSQSYQ